MSPEVIFHFGVGITAMVTGTTALIATKGGQVHRIAGRVFFAAMLATGATGALLSIRTGELGNGVAGTLTVYFMLTAWMAVRRKDGEKSGLFEIGAFLFVASGAAISFYFTYLGVQDGTAIMGGVPGYIFSSVAALCALLDLSVILRGGLSGRARIARHLWRMHLGFAIAVGSFFPGQLQLFPDYIRTFKPAIVLFTPFFLVIALLFFWLIRVWVTGRFKTQAMPMPMAAE